MLHGVPWPKRLHHRGVKVVAAWWSGLAAKPALQGDGPPSPGGSLPAVALTAKAMEGS